MFVAKLSQATHRLSHQHARMQASHTTCTIQKHTYTKANITYCTCTTNQKFISNLINNSRWYNLQHL